MSYLLPPKGDLPTSRFSAVGGWFFGPRAENFDYLKKAFGFILDRQHQARTQIYPNDAVFITDDMKATKLYQDQIDKLNLELDAITEKLSNHSVPFWSPRYNAHMSMESSMPSVIGYLAGLMHNQNNVATEASPLTTMLEQDVGRDLCHMLGYEIAQEEDPDVVTGWGHITCGGSVANLESIWAARNLKFYPLSLKLALKEGPLSYLKDLFSIELCTGQRKKFNQCTTWELLNLKPSTILDIPHQLYNQFGVSQTALSKAFNTWSIQTKGKDFLEKEFKIDLPAQIFVGTTKHYSWPKGAAIAGIGSEQIVDVPIDNQARMEVAELEKMLEASLKAERAIFAVVAIIGSTEQGAVDPLDQVVALRDKFEKRGLSFVIHCDGAWGGYFAATIREPMPSEVPTERGEPPYVPSLCLSDYTRRQLEHFKYADSITIDPHKSGYCPYPAGGLCYRDGRMRFLVTWTSPVVFRGNNSSSGQSIGVYGVEGSKPGASAVGAWLSHRILGLHQDGYGSLLGEAILTCSRLYCHWATMEPKAININGVKARLIVTPFTMLPAERKGGTPEQIEAEKKLIREHILGKDNETIFKNPEALALLKQVGGDIQINAFACNFEINGQVNTDVIEANYFNSRIFDALSVSTMKKDLSKVPLFLTSTQFSQSTYRGCLDTYKRRMGVKGDQDLYTLINVTMSPWATSQDFVQTLADRFKQTAEGLLESVVQRNVQEPDLHGFVIQGIEGNKICGVHLPMFNMQNHRWQLIISAKLPDAQINEIRKRRANSPRNDAPMFFTFGNKNKEVLEEITQDGASFEGTVQEGFPWESYPPIPGGDSIKVTDIKVLYKRSLKLPFLAASYPDQMTFYVYSAQRGTADKPIFNIDHLLSVSPNIQLNADAITFSTDKQEEAEKLIKESGCWFTLTEIHESALQPLVQKASDTKTSYDIPGVGFKPSAKYSFEARKANGNEPPAPNAPVIFKGSLRLGVAVFADADMVNADGGAPQDAPVPNSLMGLPDANTSGLVAEYPNDDTTMVELRDAYQRGTMHAFRKDFQQSRALKAQELVQRCEQDDSREVPAWAKAMAATAKNIGVDDASNLYVATTQMYHSHAH